MNWIRQEFVVFLFMLFVSASFWAFQSFFGKTYEKEIAIPIEFAHLPKNVVPLDELHDTLNVVIRDDGLALLGYEMWDKPANIRLIFNKYNKPSENAAVLTNADIHTLVKSTISRSTKIVSIKDEKIQLRYSLGKKKRVPVRVKGKITSTTTHHTHSDITPDSVDVYAVDNILDKISFAYTKSLNISGISKKTHLTAEIEKIDGARFVPASVKLKVIPVVFVEKAIVVPIVCRNEPDGIKLRLFPKSVTVKCSTDINTYSSIDKNMFCVEADYNSIASGNEDKCAIMLTKYPKTVKNPRIMKTEVDFLIEKK
ncbi:MAG: hypothetical protein HUK08_02010 [Bacteroidaceae bacterium]|nr:hypothetical protein [Bacteroidaceae bacterium]